jgi:hypothetical protein
MICPADLEPCRRAGCRGGHCERTADTPLVTCWECGTVISGHVVTRICIECVRRYTPVVEEGT